MPGFNAIGASAIGTTGGASAPPNFTGTIGCGNVVTGGAVVIAAIPMEFPSVPVVTFGTMAVPWDWKPALSTFYPVSFNVRMTVLRFTTAGYRQRVRIPAFHPVKFGTMTL